METPNKTFFCAARRGPTVWGAKAMTDYAASNAEGTGVVRKMYCIRMSQITDGTSCTMLVGDKSLPPAGLTGAQAGDTNGYCAGFGTSALSNDTIRSAGVPHQLPGGAELR